MASVAPTITEAAPDVSARDTKVQNTTPRVPVALECTGFDITDETYASTAEDLMDAYMQQYKQERNASRLLTTTTLRSIYALIMNIYVKIRTPQEYEDAKPDIQYLKVRMAYEAGREDSVKNFLNDTHLRSLVDGVTSYEQFMLYCRYAEALVAYFKFFGGKDK
jgi:CRISPR-associated protein Csm2